MVEDVIAFAVYSGNIADTVGSAEAFVICCGDSAVTVQRQEGIAIFLARHHISTLICNGIGNCLLEVLAQKNICVIPGISGSWQDALCAFRAGTLIPGKNYTCSERGQICGDCKGNY